MASITLTTKEYNELTVKAEMCDTLLNCIVDAYKVTVDDSTWRPVSINLEPQWPASVVGRIVQTVGTQLSNLPEAMEYILKNEEYVFDLTECKLDDMPYGERLYYGQYNLLEVCEAFSTEYNGLKIEHELQLEEKKAEQKAEEEPEELPVEEDE